MLVLTRKIGESIIIGDEIEVVIVEMTSTQVRLGIKAPKTMAVLRKEIYEDVRQENKKAASMQHAQDYLQAELKGILRREKNNKDEK